MAMSLRLNCRSCLRLLTRKSLRCRPIVISANLNNLSRRKALQYRRFLSKHHHFIKNQYFSRHCSLFGASDTVFALSSGHGKCGVAVVRTTGPQSRECVLKLTGKSALPEPRKAVLRKLSDPTTRDIIDHSLVLWFPGPHSFTGEDCAEFHIHGGPSVVLALLTALGRIPNCSHAQAGDFTKRAFFNGKLELTEVEGLADLIHAETEAQRKQALRQMEGDLGTLYTAWTEQLVKIVAHVEAFIDFGEDESIEDTVMDEVRSNVEKVLSKIEDHLNDGRRGERLRSGVHVAILGAPNAGKSSLLNKLCQRPAAIVSPYAGTTRDVVESALDVGGYPVVLSDTAGLRRATDPVEQEGVRRALKRVESADLCVLIGDISLVHSKLSTTSTPPLSLTQLARHLLHSYNDQSSTQDSDIESDWIECAIELLSPMNTVVVLNKTDLLSESEMNRILPVESEINSTLCWLSCKTGDGVVQFMDTFIQHLERLCGNPMSGNPSITQARHRQHLTQCTELLHNFLSNLVGYFNLHLEDVGGELLLDKAAEELRMAIREVGRITGKVGIEEILDVVFRDFCIGK